MDRFEIIKDVDPFANMPNGDGCTYEIMKGKYKGWQIDESNLILDMSENSFNFLLVLKEKKVHVINQDKRTTYFGILRVLTKTYYTDKRTKNRRVKVQFEGQLLLPF